VITVFGSINIDLVTRVPHLPRPGETVLAASYQTHCGGKGANQAVAAARASGGVVPVRMIGAVGDDGFGVLARDNLGREGVDVSRLRIVAANTGCAFIQVDDAGENVITCASGANQLLNAAALDGLPFAATDVLVLQMEVPLAENLKAAVLARSAGARIIANLAPIPAGLDAAGLDQLLAAVDILVVNEHEAAHAAAILSLPADPPGPAVKAIAARTGRTILATLGGDGALAAQPSGEVLTAAAPKITPMDTTGAGDTFVGVLAAALAEGLELRPAMTRACKAAALACMSLGAQSAMPRRAAILS
jgi:ribokinase